MGVARYRFRAELRSSWRQLVATAVVFGLVGGLALAALAGARRGSSAYPRLLEETNTGDVLVNPDLGVFSDLRHEDILELEGVEGGTYVAGVGVLPTGPDGEPLLDNPLQVFAQTDGYVRDRPLVMSGRMAARDSSHETVVSPRVADDLGVDVGDRLDMFVADTEKLEACDEEEPEGCPNPFEPIELTVVGIGRMADEVAEPTIETGRMLLSPAFLEAYPRSVFYWGGDYELNEPSRITEFQSNVAAMVPDEAVAFESTQGVIDRFQSSVRPQAVALALFGALVGAAALLFAALALVRNAAALAADRGVVVAMGASRRAMAALGLLHGLAWSIPAAVVAGITAIALSPLAPIGLARDAEPDRGLDTDLLVLAGGALLCTSVLILVSLVTATRAGRRLAPTGEPRVSRAAALLASLGGRPPVVVGTRLALEPGTGPRAVPIRSTIATVAIAVAGAVAAATFAGSLSHLLATPSEYGSNWDVALSFAGDDEAADLESPGDPAAVDENVANAIADLDAREDVDGVSVVAFAGLDIGGRSVPAMGIDVATGSAHPTVVSGRVPTTPNEIVLAHRLADRIGAAPGDHVTVGTEQRTVVGTAIFPGYAEYPGQDPTDMDDGAWLTIDGLTAAGQTFGGRRVLVDVVDGTDPAAAFAEYDAEGLSNEEAIEISDYRPSTVANLERVRTTPLVIALALALLGALAAANALMLSVRRRRGVLAILRSLGFDRRQVAATVAWQATCIAAIAATVGIPLGLVLGRVAWRTMITQLGGVSPAVVPTLAAVAAAVATLVLANLVAAIPARAAARTPAAAVLRAE
jgi:hypothetical protein